MKEKSDIEILREFAKSTNRIIVEKEIPYPLTGIRTFQKYKRMIYVPNNPEKTSFFIWFSDPYLKIGQSTIFSGAFIPLSSRIKSKINLRKKNILDKLSFRSKTKVNEIGNEHFDSRVVITGNMDTATKRLLSQTRIQEQLIKALEMDNAMRISFNEHKIEFVPELVGVQYLSIINVESWDMERNDLEDIFKRIEKIRRNISSGE